MALSWPRTDLLTSRGFSQQSFDLLRRQDISRTAGGVTIGKDFGPSLWAVEYVTGPQRFKDAVEYEAILHTLDGVIGTFEAYDLRRPFPHAHADGSFDDEATILSLGDNGKSLALGNLAPGFILSVGDRFAFDFGGLRHLHEVAEAVSANGNGETIEFEIRPHLPLNINLDDAIEVTLKTPSAIFSLLPDGMTSVMQRSKLNVITLRGVQV